MSQTGPSRPKFRLQTVCIDCADAHETADFYGRLLGWEPTIRQPNWVLMRDPGGGTGLSFQAERGYRAPRGPSSRTRRTRCCISTSRSTTSRRRSRTRSRRARVWPITNRVERVRVLLDPAGHPFCLFLD